MNKEFAWVLAPLPTPFHSAAKQFRAVRINSFLKYNFSLSNDD